MAGAADRPLLREDPVYLNCRREAILILVLWACCFVYTVTFCYLRGYHRHEPSPHANGPAIGQIVGPLERFNRDVESLSTPLGLGIPDWVLLGIVVPWLLCAVATMWFCWAFYTDDVLDDPEATDSSGAEA